MGKLGLTTREYLDKDRNAVYDTNMYIVPGGGKIKLIEIEGSVDRGFRVTPIKTNDERLNPLQKAETKTFRQSDKDYLRNTLTRVSIAVGGAAIGGLVGGLAEGAFENADAGEAMDTGDGYLDSPEIGADSNGDQMPPTLSDSPDLQIDDGC